MRAGLALLFLFSATIGYSEEYNGKISSRFLFNFARVFPRPTAAIFEFSQFIKNGYVYSFDDHHSPINWDRVGIKELNSNCIMTFSGEASYEGTNYSGAFERLENVGVEIKISKNDMSITTVDGRLRFYSFLGNKNMYSTTSGHDSTRTSYKLKATVAPNFVQQQTISMDNNSAHGSEIQNSKIEFSGVQIDFNKNEIYGFSKEFNFETGRDATGEPRSLEEVSFEIKSMNQSDTWCKGDKWL